jgi:uracil-DNA glycosylase family protein
MGRVPLASLPYPPVRAFVEEENMSARDYLPQPPQRKSLRSLRAAAGGCQGCPLHTRATQTVFGDGPASAPLMLVGEQPGNEEDQQGRAFVGPAGQLLDRALEDVGIERDQAYVTNVVKHFKWVPSGRRRLHQKPNAREVGACLPWLESELEVVRPKILVCLGATAAQALLGRTFRVSKQRGRFVESELAEYVTATVHPSSILRARTDSERRDQMRSFVADLEKVARVLRADVAAPARPRRAG